MERRKHRIGPHVLFSLLAIAAGELPNTASAGPRPCEEVKAVAVPVCEPAKKVAAVRPCDPVKAKSIPVCEPAKKAAPVKACESIKTCDPINGQCQASTPRGPVSHLTTLLGILFGDHPAAWKTVRCAAIRSTASGACDQDHASAPSGSSQGANDCGAELTRADGSRRASPRPPVNNGSREEIENTVCGRRLHSLRECEDARRSVPGGTRERIEPVSREAGSSFFSAELPAADSA